MDNFTRIPPVASIDFTHVATLPFDNGLFGFNDVINNLVILPRISSVV